MSVTVTMPQLGESVTEGTVTRWLKQVGDEVQADEPLLEVSTDKVDTEIPAPASGVLLSIAADEDETVAVGAPLGVIGAADEAPEGDARRRRRARGCPGRAAAPAQRPPRRPCPSSAAPRAPAPAAGWPSSGVAPARAAAAAAVRPAFPRTPTHRAPAASPFPAPRPR